MGQENSRLRRVETWPSKLAQFLHDRRETPFAWGLNDCLIFAADAVKEMTGHDFAASYRGTYHNEGEALELIDRIGSAGQGLPGTVYGIVRACFGTSPNENPALAGRGDVALAELDQGQLGGHFTCGVVDDTGRRVAFVTEKGLVRLPLNRAKYFWRF